MRKKEVTFWQLVGSEKMSNSEVKGQFLMINGDTREKQKNDDAILPRLRPLR